MEFLRTIFKIFDNLELETEEKKTKKIDKDIYIRRKGATYILFYMDFLCKIFIEKKSPKKKADVLCLS